MRNSLSFYFCSTNLWVLYRYGGDRDGRINMLRDFSSGQVLIRMNGKAQAQLRNLTSHNPPSYLGWSLPGWWYSKSSLYTWKECFFHIVVVRSLPRRPLALKEVLPRTPGPTSDEWDFLLGSVERMAPYAKAKETTSTEEFLIMRSQSTSRSVYQQERSRFLIFSIARAWIFVLNHLLIHFIPIGALKKAQALRDLPFLYRTKDNLNCYVVGKGDTHLGTFGTRGGCDGSCFWVTIPPFPFLMPFITQRLERSESILAS